VSTDLKKSGSVREFLEILPEVKKILYKQDYVKIRGDYNREKIFYGSWRFRDTDQRIFLRRPRRSPTL